MNPVFLSSQIKHTLGPILTPSMDKMGWKERNFNIIEALNFFFPQELAQQILEHLQAGVSKACQYTYVSPIGFSYNSGGRKFFLKANRNNPDHQKFIKYLEIFIKHNYPEIVDYANTLLPEEILIAIKGTGSPLYATSVDTFNDDTRIEGYGTKDTVDVEVTRMLAGEYMVDGHKLIIPPNRIHLGVVEIDLIDLYENGTRTTVNLMQEDSSKRLATGQNKLAISLMAEPYGPDLEAVMQRVRSIRKSKSGNEIQQIVDLIKQSIATHPFFVELCANNLPAEQWLNAYFRRLLEHCYLRSRALAYKIAAGRNRTIQNFDLTLGYRDLDDTIFPIMDIDLGTEEGKYMYLLNFYRHLSCHLEGFKDLVQYVLGFNPTEALVLFFRQNPTTDCEQLWNQKTLELCFTGFDYLGELERGNSYFLAQAFGLGGLGSNLQTQGLNVAYIAKYFQMDHEDMFSLFGENLRFTNEYLYSKDFVKLVNPTNAIDISNPISPLAISPNREVAERYLRGVIDLLFDQAISMELSGQPTGGLFVRICNAFDKSIMEYFRTRWPLSPSTKQAILKTYHNFKTEFIVSPAEEKLFEKILN